VEVDGAAAFRMGGELVVVVVAVMGNGILEKNLKHCGTMGAKNIVVFWIEYENLVIL